METVRKEALAEEGAVRARQEIDTTLERKSFTNDEKTFEFQYPAHWLHERNAIKGENEAVQEIFEDPLSVERHLEIYVCKNIVQYCSTQAASFRTNTKAEEIRLGATTFARVKLGAGTRAQIHYETKEVHAGYNYLITFFGSEDDLPYVESFLSTFRFLN